MKKRRKTAKKTAKKRVVSAETRKKNNERRKDLRRLERDAEGLIDDDKRTEDYPVHGPTLAAARFARQFAMPFAQDGKDYSRFMVLSRTISDEDERWIWFRDAMRDLGFNDRDIRSEWFSPEM